MEGAMAYSDGSAATSCVMLTTTTLTVTVEPLVPHTTVGIHI